MAPVKWRDLDESGVAIDASGSLPGWNEVSLERTDSRRRYSESDRFVTTVTEKMLTYALGRGVEYYDAPAVRTIVRDAAREDYRFTALIRGIVQSTAFQMRRSQS
jgi:hypothetical protein